MSEFDNKLVHGYVHGHIHRHKDHTHIHGHIHSHQTKDITNIDLKSNHSNHSIINDNSKIQEIKDPKDSKDPARDVDNKHPDNNSTQGDVNGNANGNANGNDKGELLECPLDSLPECDEVLCSELDDCFYLTCDDSNMDSCCTDNLESICHDINCHDVEINNHDLGNDQGNAHNHGNGNESPGSIDVAELNHSNEIICNDPKCLETEGATICCYDNSHNKNHQNNLCSTQNNDKQLFDKIFQELHQDFDLFTNKSQQSQHNQHNQPTHHILNNNLNNNLSNNLDIHDVNDGDNLSYQNKRNKLSNEIHYPHEIHPISNIHKAFFHTNIIDQQDQHHQQQQQNQNHDHNTQHNQQQQNFPLKDYDFHFNFTNKSNDITCEWDNCFKSINQDEFMNHLKFQHLKNEDIQSGSMFPSYPCEWNNCNFSDNDFYALLDHLSTHKQSKSEDILTPISNISLPESDQTSQSQSQSQTQTNNQATTATTTNNSTLITPNSFNKLNISNLSFKPKNNRKIDPNFTCFWDIGTDNYGRSIKCNKVHNNAADLQNHLINDHIGSGKSIYECKWIGCERHNGRHFTQRQKILRHVHIHTNFKPCKCEICGSTFAVESMLIQHLRTHLGEKPFQCSICNKRFATSSSLSIHNRVHTGYKPLICKICGKRFSESSNLNKHLKTHEKFKCGNCNLDFDSKVNLNKHSLVCQGPQNSNSHTSNVNANLKSNRNSSSSSTSIAPPIFPMFTGNL